MGDRIKIDPAYRQRLTQMGLDTVAKVLACQGDRTVGHGPQSIQLEVDGTAGQPPLTIKRFNYPTWPTRLNFLGRCFFGRSRAHREFRCQWTMHRLGIQSSRPLAIGERRRWGFLTDCFLISEGVPASDSLRDFAVRYFHKAASPRGRALKRELMDQLADQIRLMHGKHFYHGELGWQNILIRPTPDGKFEFFLVNALRGRRVWRPWKRRRLRGRDLAGVDAISGEFLSRGDKIRFIKRYLRVEELSEDDRRWMNQIQQISRQLFTPCAPPRPAEPGRQDNEGNPPPSQQVQTGVHP